MNDLQLILYDDAYARNWFPFTLTRPAGELLFGACTQRERAERIFGARCLGHLTDPALAGFDETEAAPILSASEIDATAARLFLSSRAVPAWGARVPTQRTALRIGPEPVGFYCPPNSPSPVELELAATSAAPAYELAGCTLRNVWELISRNAQQITTDLEWPENQPWSRVPDGTHVLGEPRLKLGKRVAIEPDVVLDFRNGPIHLDDDVEVRAFTRLAGPAYVSRRTSLLGGSLSAVSIGPRCKVHGEVEAVVMLGYSNKAHDGFLGHAYIGCWVNLGALTTNSDLKNNYGSIRMWTPQGEVDTGELKLGCLLGDHVKTAIGSMINTGTVVGPGSNLFGGMPPKYVPAFSWGAELAEYEFEKFLATANTALHRRDMVLSPGQREMLRRAWERGRKLNAAARS
jgi:UDP-N-acetylglucosamine diphosphorylase/glucosamine-1-phosphate N-acetyltransferase